MHVYIYIDIDHAYYQQIVHLIQYLNSIAKKNPPWHLQQAIGPALLACPAP